MPLPASSSDKNRKHKNFTVLMVLLALIALVFAITLMKMANTDLISALQDKAATATPAQH